MTKLVLLRHGFSQWNKENRFTGWHDIDLAPEGVDEAREAGRLLKAKGFTFDSAYTSVLKRAIHTLWTVLDELDQAWLPVIKDWHLNERHYGALTGLNKADTARKYGEAQLKIWRRSYDTPPDPVDDNSEYHPRNDARYQHIPSGELPATECLKDTVARFVPYFEQTILPQIKAGKRILITAHGNSLRALVKHLDGISDEDIVNLNIPTAIPLVYEFDAAFKPVKHYYLGDAAKAEAAAAAVANQAEN